MRALLFVLAVFVISAHCAAPTATAIPFLGIATPPTPGYFVGQLITQVSDLISFSFYTLAVRPAAGATATGIVREWVGSAPSTTNIASVSVTLSSSASYSLLTVTTNVVLDPSKTYVIALSIVGVDSSQYTVATKRSAGATGGYVENVDGVWNSGFATDVIFALDTKNLLAVNPQTNSASGPPPLVSGTGGWGCTCNTTFSAIQVNWANLKVNTGYYGSASAKFVSCTPGSTAPTSPTFTPYGTAAQCGYRPAWAYIDLTGTNYYVAENFVAYGYLPPGNAGERYRSSNNQIVQVYGTGDCGYAISESAKAIFDGLAAGTNENFILFNGGFGLQLGKL